MPHSTAVEPPAASEGGPAMDRPDLPPKPRLSMTGLRKLLSPRTADPLSASTPRRLARALFESDSEGSFRDNRGGVLGFLERVPLFEGLGRLDLQRVARIVHEREYGDGEYISREGMPGAALFILKSGFVEVTRRGRDGANVMLVTLEPPASFEEEAATGMNTTRWFSTRARGPVSVLALGRSDLDALADAFPPLANKVLMRLAGTMSTRFQRVLDALYITESLEAGGQQESKS